MTMARLIAQSDGAQNFWEFSETMVGVLRWGSRSMDQLEGMLVVLVEVAKEATDRPWWMAFFDVFACFVRTTLFFLRRCGKTQRGPKNHHF